MGCGQRSQCDRSSIGIGHAGSEIGLDAPSREQRGILVVRERRDHRGPPGGGFVGKKLITVATSSAMQPAAPMLQAGRRASGRSHPTRDLRRGRNRGATEDHNPRGGPSAGTESRSRPVASSASCSRAHSAQVARCSRTLAAALASRAPTTNSASFSLMCSQFIGPLPTALPSNAASGAAFLWLALALTAQSRLGRRGRLLLPPRASSSSDGAPPPRGGGRVAPRWLP